MLKWAALALLAAACQVEERGGAPHANDGHDSEVHASNASMTVPADQEEKHGEQQDEKLEADSLATFAGGCFWCMETPFEGVPGVTAVISGYIDGHVVDPTYTQVCTGTTGHTEAVQVHYDSRRIRYEDLLQIYWRQFDPTDAGGSFHDRGSQYRSGVYTHDEAQRLAAEKSKQELAASGRFDKPIVTEIKPATKFYAAEEYHQDYYLKQPKDYYKYRTGSGRDRFIERIWGDDREYVPKGVPASASAPWLSFKKPSEAKLREELTSLQYQVTQQDGTERPFDNEYWDNKQAGLYVDIVSGEPLFSSRDKFKSGTGWPSFTRPVREDSLEFDTDQKLGYTRDEVRSRYADSHLGHVFEDGPAPTGLRYCINSAALRFIPKEELAAKGYADFLSEVE